jgi:signal transduction histidine kinase
MLGFTDLILEEFDVLTKTEIRDYVQKVHDSSYSTFTLLENLLNWSRLQTGRLQNKPLDVNINEEITSVINLLNSNAQHKRINLINLVSPEYILFADQQMVHSILLNLTTNAIKFTFPGGRIVFDAQIIDSYCESLSEPNQFSQKCLEISVSDDGIGISSESLEKLFKIDINFSMSGTLNEQGAGLGLILVKEMVDKQGGRIEVESILDKGSVFKFTLPLAAIHQI